MIVFELKCSQGHLFEGWFDDGNAYEDQKARGLLTCPVCSDTCISKVPTAFSIASSGGGTDVETVYREAAVLRNKISAFLEKNFDNVGTRFAAEALKIHYGVSEPRNIRGTSTPAEEETLKSEGIEFIKIPAGLDE